MPWPGTTFKRHNKHLSDSEAHGIKLCERSGCSTGPHFHVAIPGSSGRTISIKGDEENLKYFMDNAEIKGYRGKRSAKQLS